MNLNELEQITEPFISVEVAAEASGIKRNTLREQIKAAARSVDHPWNMSEMKEALGYSAYMSGNRPIISRRSFINYIKENGG